MIFKEEKKENLKIKKEQGNPRLKSFRVSQKLNRENMASSLYYFEPKNPWLMMAHYDP